MSMEKGDNQHGSTEGQTREVAGIEGSDYFQKAEVIVDQSRVLS